MNMSSILLGAVFIGFITGAIPAILGVARNRIVLAIGGFISCLVSTLILGLILAIPVCAIFSLIILITPENINYKSQ